MKKGIVLGATMIMSCFLLMGCHIKHEWQEATCTEPRTCIVGGETEGEPLGHTWADATCTEPRTCSICGETEGEPLGHGTLTEANYQQGPVCTVCGETVGEPLEADFEKYGFTCNTEFDVPCALVEDLTTVATVTFSDYMLTDSFELFDVPEGYVVQAVTVIYDYSVDSVNFANCLEDYYDIVTRDDTKVASDNDIATYTVSFNGIDYTECKYYIGPYFYDAYDIINTGDVAIWNRFYFCVPEGYDGTVIGFHDNRTPLEDSMYIYDVADENTVFFRLPAASGEMGGKASADSFEDHGLVINAKEGVTYDYVTSCKEDTSKKRFAI